MGPSSLRCYLMGARSLLIHCGEVLTQRGHQVLGVISSAETVVKWATERQLPVFAPGPDLAARLVQPFDYLFSITNLSVIPPDVLALAGRGAVNFHDGPLPRYAGLNATAWAILNGETSHGISWHLIEGGIDEGDLLKQETFPIDPDETSFSLNTRCYEAGIASFPELVDELAAGTSRRTPQDLSQRTYFGRNDRPEAAGVIRWDRPAAEIVALVRGLDFGPVENEFCSAKLLLGCGSFLIATAAEAGPGQAPPGTILGRSDDSITVAADQGAVALRGLRLANGEPAQTQRLIVGDRLPILDADTAARWTALGRDVSRHERFWAKRLGRLDPLDPPGGAEAGPDAAPAIVRGGFSADDLVTAVVAFLASLTDQDAFTIGFRGRLPEDAGALFADVVPLLVEVDPQRSFRELAGRVAAELAEARRRGTYCRDLPARYPGLPAPSGFERVSVVAADNLESVRPPSGAELTIAVAADGSACRWFGSGADGLSRRFGVFLAALSDAPDRSLREQPLLTADECQRVIGEWNDTACPVPERCVHELIEDQARRAPDALALACGRQELCYRELDARANRLAHHLRGKGVGPGTLVGLCLERSSDLVVAMLAILKGGGAYVPLDPAYPRARVELMLEDSAAPVLVTTDNLRQKLGLTAAHVVCLDRDAAVVAAEPAGPVESGARPDALAYVLYTSGSTGKPKGVMVDHRNVVNFFVGMDGLLGTDPGVWLAVTSPSFDISVLELLWTLARGYKVVLHTGEAVGTTAPGAGGRPTFR